jgi:predicted AAA+ superfamily ATPase
MQFSRQITPLLQKAAQMFPIVTLTGPRQSGKTTLLKQLFTDYQYINLEDPEQLLRLQADPKGVLQQGKWVIDEAQRYPELFSYLQILVDAQPQAGRFILSGSQHFLLTESINQSLAGRTLVLELLPLSYQEFLSHPHIPHKDLWAYLYQGSYPRPYQEKLDIALWYSSYLRTYLERDVRSLVNIKDLSRFQKFLKLCAGFHGQLLNQSAIAAACGVANATIDAWLGILQTSRIIFLLQPYHRNFKKRVVKTPKLFFYDSAIVCQLLGIESAEHLQLHSSRGAIFEGFVLAEMIKYYSAQGKTAPLYFWRDHQGHEVDGLIERAENLYALEVKSGQTLTDDRLKGLKQWQKISSTPAEHAYLIYAGSESYTLQGMHILSWQALADPGKAFAQCLPQSNA